MKKLAGLLFLVLLFGAAVPVSAAENTNSEASITFYQPVSKVVPMKKIVMPEEQNQEKIAISEKTSDENLAGFLPKTNEEKMFFGEVMGVGFLGIVFFFVVYKKIDHRKTASKKKSS